MSESSPSPKERGRRFLEDRDVDLARDDVRAGLSLLVIYLLDGVLLAGFCWLGLASWVVPPTYIAVGIVVVGGFAFAAARAGKAALKQTNAVLVQTLVALLLTLCVAWFNRNVTVLMLLTVVVIIPTAALRLAPATLMALAAIAALGASMVVIRQGGQLSMPVTSAAERALTTLFILWTLIKGASVNLAGIAMRRALNDSHVRLVSALERVEELAERDELTGLPNRRRILEVLARARKRQTKTGGQYSVAMLDLDHFKRINDSFGHAMGDEVLRVVGTILCSAARSAHVAGRLGGEEFLLILPESGTLTDAMAVAERLRGEVERYDWSTLQSELRVTASIGLAVADTDEHTDAVLKRADQGLYEAKRSGRNRVSYVSAQRLASSAAPVRRESRQAD